jgi:hypothetical protein
MRALGTTPPAEPLAAPARRDSTDWPNAEAKFLRPRDHREMLGAFERCGHVRLPAGK